MLQREEVRCVCQYTDKHPLKIRVNIASAHADREGTERNAKALKRYLDEKIDSNSQTAAISFLELDQHLSDGRITIENIDSPKHQLKVNPNSIAQIATERMSHATIKCYIDNSFASTRERVRYLNRYRSPV